MRITFQLVLGIALSACFAVTALADEGKNESAGGKQEKEKYQQDKDGGRPFPWYGHSESERDKDKDISDKEREKQDREKEGKEGKHRDYDRDRNEGKAEKDYKQGRHEDGDNSYFKRHGYSRLDIPPGHYPPPGECRIWHPDRPAGQQPPPGRCEALRREVPPGAWLMRHPEDGRNVVNIDAYDDRLPDRIREIGEFSIATGELLRILTGQ